MGKALHCVLKEQYSVNLYYSILEKSDIATQQLDFSQFNVIIGTTGETSLPHTQHHKLMPGTFLCSASSSDREFDAHHLRTKIKAKSDCHSRLDVGGVRLVNSGFPVNFYATNYDNVPLEDIQLTFALILYGVCQKRTNQNGFVKVCDLIQDQVIAGMEQNTDCR